MACWLVSSPLTLIHRYFFEIVHSRRLTREGLHLKEVYLLRELSVLYGQDSSSNVRVASDKFGAGCHADVGAQGQRLLKHRGQNAVVHHDQSTSLQNWESPYECLYLMIPGFPAAYAWLCSPCSAALDQCGLNLSAGCAAKARLLISLTKITYGAEIMDPPSKQQGLRCLTAMCLTLCDMSTKLLMSQICILGLVGDSSITSRVRPGFKAFSKALH